MNSRRLTSAVILALSLFATSSPSAEGPSVLVRTVPLQKGRLSQTITCYGFAATDPRNSVTLSLPRAGRISRMLVSQGQVVRQSAPLADFVTDPSAVQGYRQALSALRFARGELTRTEQMAAQMLATNSQLAAARKAVSDAEAAVAGQRRLGMERVSERLRAPFPGTVTAVSAKEGDVLAAGAAILQMSKSGALLAVLGVEPEDAGRIGRGMTVRLAPVFDPGQSYPGTVREVHGVVDAQTRLVDVVVAIRGGGKRLVAGSRLRGEIAIGAATGWLVPRQAILRGERGPFLYQVESGHARLVPVLAGIEQGGQVEVRGKVDPRLPVVVIGNYELADGMAVREERR